MFRLWLERFRRFDRVYLIWGKFDPELIVKIFKFEGANAGANELDGVKSKGGHHAANLAVFTFVDSDFKLGFVFGGFKYVDFGRLSGKTF